MPEPRCAADEEHSAFTVTFHDSTNAERHIGIDLASQPEYRQFRVAGEADREIQRAAVHGGAATSIATRRRTGANCWNYVKAEGKRDASVQRYKGLGEMNAEQLAETTMNPEKRTLLEVRLEDVVETDQIFTTLMGEDVESRRKFIEDNALDVKNLDV